MMLCHICRVVKITLEDNWLDDSFVEFYSKPVLSSSSKTDKTKVLKTNGSLMKVESIAECSKGSILQYF